MNRNINFKVLVPGVVITVLLLAGLWLWSQYGYIQVATDNIQGGSVEIISKDKSSIQKISDTKTEKLLKKGNYNVYVQNNDSSYVTAVRVGGFGKRTVVTPTLKSERQRTFIGDNPLPCVVYADQKLRSYECTGDTKTFVAHMPSQGSQATYTLPEKITQGTIAGVVSTNSNTIVIARPFVIDSPEAYYAYTQDASGTYKGVKLSDIDGTKTYTVKPYKAGFVMYTENYDELYYYPSVDSEPQKISLTKPKDSSLEPFGLETNANRIAILYTNNKQGSVADIHDPADVRKLRNSIVLYTDEKPVIFEANKTQVAQAMPCGKSLLCLWSSENIKIYKTKDNKLSFDSEIYDIEGMSTSGETLYVNRSKEIVTYKPEEMGGYISYSLGDYTLCGSQIWSNGQVVCLITPKNKKTALLINEGSRNTDSIDQKVATLSKSSSIKSLSVYGNNIIVNPENGAVVYSSSLGSYTYDPVYVKKQIASINQAVSDAGIDRGVYSINIIGN